MKVRILLLVSLLVLAALSAPTAFAAPRDVCVSNASGNWGTAGTWSCWVVPTNADIVIINNGHTVTLDTNGQAYQLIVGGGTSGTLTQDATSRTLSVGAGGVSVSNGGTFNSPSTLNISGNMTVNGTFNGGSATVSLQGDLSISSGGAFTAPSAMTISGNFANSGTFNHNGGTVTMAGSSASSISSSGSVTFNNLTIANSAGVNLTSDATVQGTLTLNYDLQVASGYALTMAAASTTSGNADVVGKTRRVSPASSTPYTFGSAYTTINFGSGGTLPSEVSVELFKSAPGGLANAVQRYYSITPTGGSGYTFDLRLHYRDTELNGIPEADLQMWRQDSGRWTLQPRTGNNTTDNWVEKTGLTTFSLWALSNSGAPTAVTLSTFDARADAPNALPFIGLGGLALLALGGTVVWRGRAANH